MTQFGVWGVNGVALEVLGLTNNEQFDPVSLLMFGLIFESSLIWTRCPVIDDTVWTNCTTYGATWTLCPGVTTTWTSCI